MLLLVKGKNLVFLLPMIRQLVDKERENNRFELYLSNPTHLRLFNNYMRDFSTLTCGWLRNAGSHSWRWDGQTCTTHHWKFSKFETLNNDYILQRLSVCVFYFPLCFPCLRMDQSINQHCKSLQFFFSSCISQH